MHDDKGGKYMSAAFIRCTNECGIERRHSTWNRPKQNGDAERANRTLAEDITAMLFEAGLPPSFWYWALGMQIKVGNCLPTASLPGKTPYGAWYNNKPDLSDVRVFGCTAYVHVQSTT
jgi:transposase InsO family protein